MKIELKGVIINGNKELKLAKKMTKRIEKIVLKFCQKTKENKSDVLFTHSDYIFKNCSFDLSDSYNKIFKDDFLKNNKKL